ncbi:unnamed protein product [Calypogeia fissa]
MLNAFGAIPINLPGTAHNKAWKERERVRSFLKSLVHERKNEEDSECDIRRNLLEAREKAQGEEGTYYGEAQIVDEMIAAWVGSFKTTASTLKFTVKYLVDYPDAFKKTQAEQLEILEGKDLSVSGPRFTLEDTKKIKRPLATADEGRSLVEWMAWNHTFRGAGGVNSALFEEIAGWLEGVRIRRSLLLPSGVMEVSLIFFTICMSMLASSYAQSGFLSIDCGSTQTNYTDSFGLKWVTDSGTYMTTGTSFQQSSVNWTFLNSTAGAGMQALQSFRYFPDRRSKYCYNLKTDSSFSYLIRASFYMNEEELNKRAPFQFFTYLNGTQWFTLTSSGTQQTNPGINDLFVTQEAIFSTPGQVMYFCLQPVVGVPFISSLELRQLAPIMYSYSGNQLQYLSLLFRYNLGPQSTTPEVVRFPADAYDRVWKTFPTPYDDYQSDPTPPDNITRAEVNYVPPKVMQDASILIPGESITVPFYNVFTSQASLPPVELAYVVAYTESINSSEIEPYSANLLIATIGSNIQTSGLVNVSAQASMLVTPNYPIMAPRMSSISFACLSVYSNCEDTLVLPLNAAEAYAQYNFNFSQTFPSDDDSIRALKRNLSLTDWQGDPCVPVPYDWLTCQCYLCEEGKGTLFSEYVVDSLTLANLSKSELSFFKDGFYSSGLTSLSITSSGIDNPNFEAILAQQYLYESLTYL